MGSFFFFTTDISAHISFTNAEARPFSSARVVMVTVCKWGGVSLGGLCARQDRPYIKRIGGPFEKERKRERKHVRREASKKLASEPERKHERASTSEQEAGKHVREEAGKRAREGASAQARKRASESVGV